VRLLELAANVIPAATLAWSARGPARAADIAVVDAEQGGARVDEPHRHTVARPGPATEARDCSAEPGQPGGGEDDLWVEALRQENDSRGAQLERLVLQQGSDLFALLAVGAAGDAEEILRRPPGNHGGIGDRLQKLELVAMPFELEDDR